MHYTRNDVLYRAATPKPQGRAHRRFADGCAAWEPGSLGWNAQDNLKGMRAWTIPPSSFVLPPKHSQDCLRRAQYASAHMPGLSDAHRHRHMRVYVSEHTHASSYTCTRTHTHPHAHTHTHTDRKEARLHACARKHLTVDLPSVWRAHTSHACGELCALLQRAPFTAISHRDVRAFTATRRVDPQDLP